MKNGKLKQRLSYHGKIKSYWIKSLVDNIGNEPADEYTKEAMEKDIINIYIHETDNIIWKRIEKKIINNW